MKLLFLAPDFPEPAVKGYQGRAYHQIRELAKRHEITLVCFGGEGTVDPREHPTAAACREVITVAPNRWERFARLGLAVVSGMPFQAAFYQARAMEAALRACLQRERFDVVIVQLMRMGPYMCRADRPPVAVDLIDSLALNMQARATAAKVPLCWLWAWEARRSKRLEVRIVEEFEVATLISESDRSYLGAEAARVVPNGVDRDLFAYQEIDPPSPTLIFFGNLQYFANVEAAVVLAERVLPLVRRRVPDIRLHIVGASPHRRVLALRAKGIVVTGYVPSLVPYLRQATVAVFPIRSRSGVQTKVLEAMAAGVAVVATPQVLEGIPAEPGRELVVGDTPQELTDRILVLLGDGPRRRRQTRAARRFIEQHYSWQESVNALEALLYTARSRHEQAPPRSA